MLELPGLLLGPWTPPRDAPAAERQTAPAPTRVVLDPVSRRRRGVVRRRARPWLRWLGREVLEIYETESEDESLLCKVCAPWWLTWAWEVYDAEDRRIAVARGPEILDGFGRPLAVLRWVEEGRVRKFLAVEGVELGEWIATGEETLLRFSAAVASQPFTKMALLGVLLCQG